MSELFNRKVILLVGKRGQTGRLITDLRMTFRIEKSLEKNPNSSMVSVYNVNNDTRRIIEQEGAVCQLKAGYGETEPPLLFTGDLTRATTKINGADFITEMEAMDGGEAYQTSEVDVSFSKGVESGQILSGVLDSMGLTKGTVVDFKSALKYLSGFVFSGRSTDALDTILGKQNLTWSIQDNQLQILPRGKSTTEEAVILTPKTGLIGSPFITKVLNSDLLKKKDGKEAESGLRFISLLNPLLRPGRLVSIDARLVQGLYRVEKVSHNGDTHGNNFYSECEAKAIS